jgi:hypothetical protein
MLPPRLMLPLLAAQALALVDLAVLPTVGYVVEESRGSWQPLDPDDIEKTIEHAALEVLSKRGKMQLERIPKQKAKTGALEPKTDYVLEIKGRAVDEAETHSVYLTFGPGARTDVASFRASDTVPLQKQSRAAMLSAIEASARKAAAELSDVLEPHLEVSRRSDGAEPPADLLATKRDLPWKWAEVRVPAVSSLRAAEGIYSKKDHERAASLRELTSLALVESSPRNALEKCALEHHDPAMRLGCLVALRPHSRRHAPTQRVVIEAFRKDRSDDVVKEASEQMTYFSGLSLKEAAQAWLERAAKCEVYGPLDKLGDLPNLDLAVRSCLIECGKRPKYQRSKRACIEMLNPIPLARRRRILMRFLQETNPDSPYFIEGAGKSEHSTGTDWQWAVEAVLDGATSWDPKLEDILWARYQRTLSDSSIDVLSEYADPSEKLVGEMIELVQTAGARQGLWGLKRIAKADPKLRPQIIEKLSELSATSAYPKTLSPHDLEQTIKELEGERNRR